MKHDMEEMKLLTDFEAKNYESRQEFIEFVNEDILRLKKRKKQYDHFIGKVQQKNESNGLPNSIKELADEILKSSET